MAPATSTRRDEVKDVEPGCTEDYGSLIESFVIALAKRVQELDTNRVIMMSLMFVIFLIAVYSRSSNFCPLTC